jgi:magnesium transporter
MHHHRESLHKRLRRRPPPGSPPGTISPDPSLAPPRTRVFLCGPQAVHEQDVASPEELADLLGKAPVTWIDVDGVGDARTIESLGNLLGLHRLTMEDIVNVYQRPKLEAYEGYLFIVLRMPHCCADRSPRIVTEQVSLCLTRSLLMTFQQREMPGDVWEPVRNRLRGRSRICSEPVDYLAYALIDSVIDSYFPVLEQLGDALEEIEHAVLDRPDHRVMEEIHAIKRDLITIRRATWPLRELAAALIREDTPLVSPGTRVYLRDCYDHAVQIMDLVESYRDLASGLMDVYLSSVSYRLNEVMKVLTIIATIFIPLTFISSIYGMNFEHMPELRWRYGYAGALGIMALVAATMVGYFWRKGWIGRRARPKRDEGRPGSGPTPAGPS